MALINCEECHQSISSEAFVCPQCGFRRYKPSDADKQVRRNLADGEVRNDWEKSIDHLLRDIHEESLDKTRPEAETISRTLARFAALLARLSRDAYVSADKNIKIQIRLSEEAAISTKQVIQHTEKLTNQTDVLVVESRKLGRLTWALILLTIGLLAVTAGLLWIDWHREVPFHKMP